MLQPTWLEQWDWLAFITVESEFDAFKYFYRHVNEEGAYGLMQLPLSIARQFDFIGAPEKLYDGIPNLELGLRYLAWIWEHLERALSRPPSTEEWVAAFGMRLGAIKTVRALVDPTYFIKWRQARDYWQHRIARDGGGIVPADFK